MINHIIFTHENANKPQQGFKLKYHATDGWRGYYDVVPPKGHESIHSDWATGEWDDAGEHKGSEVEKKVRAFEKQHRNITVVHSPTSNVFSTGVDVFVSPRKEDKGDKIRTMAIKMKRK